MLRQALLAHSGGLGIGIGREMIDRDHDRHIEFADVLDMAEQVGGAAFTAGTFSWPSSALATPPCILSARTSGDDDDGGRLKAGLPALDV